MKNFTSIMVSGALAAAVGLALASPAQAAWQALPLERGATPAQSAPASACTAFSISKHYTLADPDFGVVRARLNATLAAALPGRAGRLAKAAGHRIAPDAVQFGLRLEHAACGAIEPGSEILPPAWRGGSAKECLVPDCAEPVPGWRAPEGSTMALWTCEHNIFRQVVYERVNGTWVAVSVEEEEVVSCELMRDPVEAERGGPNKPTGPGKD